MKRTVIFFCLALNFRTSSSLYPYFIISTTLIYASDEFNRLCRGESGLQWVSTVHMRRWGYRIVEAWFLSQRHSIIDEFISSSFQHYHGVINAESDHSGKILRWHARYIQIWRGRWIHDEVARRRRWVRRRAICRSLRLAFSQLCICRILIRYWFCYSWLL